MNKKGAIEFSMTTIMIVIIGIAVLALGLAWVRGTFKQVSEMSDTAFEQAKTQLAGELSADNRIIIVPNSLNLGTNDKKTIAIGCYNNLNTPQAAELTILDPALSKTTIVWSTPTLGNIEAGGKAYWSGIATAKTVTDNTPSEILTIGIQCNGGEVEYRTLTITYK